MQGGHDYDYYYTYCICLQVALAVSKFVLILMGGVMKLTQRSVRTLIRATVSFQLTEER